MSEVIVPVSVLGSKKHLSDQHLIGLQLHHSPLFLFFVIVALKSDSDIGYRSIMFIVLIVV